MNELAIYTSGVPQSLVDALKQAVDEEETVYIRVGGHAYPIEIDSIEEDSP